MKCRTNQKAPKAGKSASPGTTIKVDMHPNGLTYPVPPPPKGLTKLEREVWLELKASVEFLNIYTPAHYQSYRLLVDAVAKTRRLHEVAPSSVGRVISTASMMLSRFGLDPASNEKVSVVSGVGGGEQSAPGTSPGDKADEFLFGGPKLVASNG